jgi:hypothetical protein
MASPPTLGPLREAPVRRVVRYIQAKPFCLRRVLIVAPPPWLLRCGRSWSVIGGSPRLCRQQEGGVDHGVAAGVDSLGGPDRR